MRHEKAENSGYKNFAKKVKLMDPRLDGNLLPLLHRVFSCWLFMGRCLGIALLLATNHLGALPVLNNPHDQAENHSFLYSSFAEKAKHLDPARSYSSNEYVILGQIYEPPLQYHYLLRPYQLEPLTLESMPEIIHLDQEGKVVEESKATYTRYILRLLPDILYHQHPAFAKNANDQFTYHNLGKDSLAGHYTLGDFHQTDTRKLTANDYIYQIKRLADKTNFCPIISILAKNVVGFDAFSQLITEKRQSHPESTWLDLRKFAMRGVKKIDNLTFSIDIHAGYPQFIYWLSMPFFAPVPWEADAFYSQPLLRERNITLDWHPIGTGPFFLTENNPNYRVQLDKNPWYRKQYYPSRGSAKDRELGLLDDAGQQIPILDGAIYSLEKENISHWNKFLQGYYDTTGVSSNSFDTSIRLSDRGEYGLTSQMANKNIKLATSQQASVIYIGFNMLDPVVGGTGKRTRLLRRAISLAIDMEEYISIFMNGRGIAAQSPIPPGIFGHLEGRKGINPYTYKWEDGHAVRLEIEIARRLMTEAGYPQGVNEETGEQLVLYFDTAATGPDTKSWFNWLRKQFRKIGIQLVIRSTDYNRFQEKMSNGNAQIYRWGWNADYPDPENFLFLFYSPNSKAKNTGENASNYDNSLFDAKFEEMRGMSNSEEREAIIADMLQILQADAPWVWGVYPLSFGLQHGWLLNFSPNMMAHNTLKYLRIDKKSRQEKLFLWNQPRFFPFLWGALLLIFLTTPAFYVYLKKQRSNAFGKQ